jgi:hypothetical protein
MPLYPTTLHLSLKNFNNLKGLLYLYTYVRSRLLGEGIINQVLLLNFSYLSRET